MKMRHVLLTALLVATPALAARDYAQEALPDARQEAQAVALMDTIRCVVCQGQPISGSNADLAADMRRMIRERIAAGEKPEQVRAWLVSRYGDWVSFKPQVKATTAPLWLIPLLAVAGGIVLVAGRLKRTRR
jgi:cytochrome c-type biogenesis protein CcmH